MADGNGKFVVSLDFELMWGVRDVVTKETYGEHIRGVHHALPGILERFSRYDIRGTFASVGFLFFENKQEMLENLPPRKPAYSDSNLSPYGNYITDVVGNDRTEDPYHFGDHLIRLIASTPGQEIGSHTFSHYYCLEPGQTAEDFSADLAAAINIGKKRGIAITSIIFPRNQVNTKYLKTCAEQGIVAYRSNEQSWIYAARNVKNENLLRRAVRLADSYINLSGHHCYNDDYMRSEPMIRIPSSRFLRPYTKKLHLLEGLRLRRIKKSMTHAATTGKLYHLWWHPHNFGINQAENFLFLEKILEHYQYLHKKYNFTSITMTAMAELLNKGK